MATPEEITPLILQAWQKDPEAHFFDLFYEAFHTNETVFSLANMTNEEFMQGWQQFIDGTGPQVEGQEQIDTSTTETTAVPEGTPESAPEVADGDPA